MPTSFAGVNRTACIPVSVREEGLTKQPCRTKIWKASAGCNAARIGSTCSMRRGHGTQTRSVVTKGGQLSDDANCVYSQTTALSTQMKTKLRKTWT